MSWNFFFLLAIPVHVKVVYSSTGPQCIQVPTWSAPAFGDAAVMMSLNQFTSGESLKFSTHHADLLFKRVVQHRAANATAHLFDTFKDVSGHPDRKYGWAVISDSDSALHLCFTTNGHPHRLFDADWHGMNLHVSWHPDDGVQCGRELREVALGSFLMK
ncbi:hypothetical protein K438DRAFT_1781602 [Mycena galopus ATCC 62051]|nr:hypothetical protein K438DRAFT_1781602 [Mycena galopus ATCC 62051]